MTVLDKDSTVFFTIYFVILRSNADLMNSLSRKSSKGFSHNAANFQNVARRNSLNVSDYRVIYKKIRRFFVLFVYDHGYKNVYRYVNWQIRICCSLIDSDSERNRSHLYRKQCL